MLSKEKMAERPAQAWIISRPFDLAFILAPSFIVTALVLAFPNLFGKAREVPIWAWVVLVMFIDVAHVYSTLFRTYFDPRELSERPALYFMTPVLAWLGSVLAYSYSSQLFWTMLAYIAVFHFVRQQYGFMMIYSRKQGDQPGYAFTLDRIAIYAATIYPLVHWHLNMPKNFNWFVEGDFIGIPAQSVEPVFFAAYLTVVVAYFVKEVSLWVMGKGASLGRVLLFTGTALAWYAGIVVYNGDFAFTLTNVVSHGVPYIAIVWAYGHRRFHNEMSEPDGYWLARVFRPKFLPAFLVILLGLAVFEEALWDALVWRDHGQVFGLFYWIPLIEDSATLTWLVPLLVLPQLTHYILDGFIWRIKKPDHVFNELLNSSEG